MVDGSSCIDWIGVFNGIKVINCHDVLADTTPSSSEER